MGQAADFWKRDHLTIGDRLYSSRRRRVFRQREMSPRAVIGNVSGERAPEMRLVEDDYVIETLPTDGSDQPLDIGILPSIETRRCRKSRARHAQEDSGKKQWPFWPAFHQAAVRHQLRKSSRMARQSGQILQSPPSDRKFGRSFTGSQTGQPLG